ncbi:MAG: tetratricopeptide repeat protein [Pseudomonadota bacterium]
MMPISDSLASRLQRSRRQSRAGRAAAFAVIASLAGGAGAAAQTSGAFSEPAAADAGQSRYERCLERARSDPDRAREEAAQWRAAGGGALARHCGAVALIGQGAEWEAARILTELGSTPGSALSADARASMLRLAGDLWLRLDQPDLAAQCFDAALGLRPGDRDGLVGAGRAAAALGDMSAAERRLTEALIAAPEDAEARTLRAAARRLQGRYGEALEDATRATTGAPQAALAWFERGAAERALGRDDAARESWIRASSLDLEGPAGDEARFGLQRLDAAE